MTKQTKCDKIIYVAAKAVFLYAGVAESADALASGASLRKEVWVQVPSPAPKFSAAAAAENF